MRKAAVILILALMVPTLVLAGGDPSTKSAEPIVLTWNDAPVTTPLRHKGDIVDRLGDLVGKPKIEIGADFHTGDRIDFILGTTARESQNFELLYISDYAYFWFQTGANIDPRDIEQAANRFDNEIVPLIDYIYNGEIPEGIDHDRRIHLVHVSNYFPSLAGFFSPDDQCSVEVCVASNEKDMLYLMLDYGPINSDLYLATLAHELQHLIQFHTDGNEYRWMDEGISQLVEHLNGFTNDPINNDNVRAFFNNPNHTLNTWSVRYGGLAPFYGAGYLFTVYLYERFGLEFIQALVQDELDGLAAVNHVLNNGGYGTTMDELVADWHVANLLDNPFVGDGRYYYSTYELPTQVAPNQLSLRNGSASYRASINQYGAEYIEILEPGRYELTFTGDAVTNLIPVAPTSGNSMWWSYNATASVTALTRAVDLTEVGSATLQFNLWYDTGDFPGYMHILVSEDSQHWTPVEGIRSDVPEHTGEDAPSFHYQGSSGRWLEESVNLNDYAGKPIDLRFEYVTNNAVAGPGFAIDDIQIPEINWNDDVETDTGEWLADGFLRTGQDVAQNWAIQFVTRNDTPQPISIPVENGAAQATIDIPTSGGVIVLSAFAPLTLKPANYRLELRPASK